MGFVINPYRFFSGGISSPEDVSGLVLWLDATDTDTLWQDAGITPVTSNADPVYRWQNKASGGSSQNFDRSSNRPTYYTGVQNGNAAITFSSGEEQRLLYTDGTTNFTSNFTIFAVFTQDASETESAQAIFNTGGVLSSRFSILADTRASTKRVAHTPSGVWINLLSEQSPAWKLTSVALTQSTSAQGFLNGVSQETVAPTIDVIPTDNEIGAQGGNVRLNGSIGEILVYNSALSTDNREAVESYLMTRWGIT